MKKIFCFALFSISSLLFTNSFSKDFKGAEYRTKLAYTYGRFEVRMKSANREGMLSSFFTYFTGTDADPWTTNKWNEIDIEILGRYENDFQMNTITPGQANHVSRAFMNSSPHLDYHTYAFEWTPQYVAWFIDGAEVMKQTLAHISTLTRPQKIMMNIWNPQYESWVGKFYPESLPAFAYYDWVSYYAYTPGSGNYGTGNNFTLDWKDEFDFWDTNRWDKATHTWDGNGCDMIPDNAVFQDGKLILCLTNKTDIGYKDILPPMVLWARASDKKIIIKMSEEIEKKSAENILNYTLPGDTIVSATLLSDFKTIELVVNGMDLNSTINVFVRNLLDQSSAPNKMAAVNKKVIITKPLVFPIKINCGGPAALNFLPDSNWNENVEYGYMDGNSNSFYSFPIANTELDSVYQTTHNGMVYYNVRVPNGSYNVKLMFAENEIGYSGGRIFDVFVQSKNVIPNLDIFSRVQKNKAFEFDLTNVVVENGVMQIYFGAKLGIPIINGIIITQNSTDVNEEQSGYLNEFRIEQNYPNPFNGQTTINYSINTPSNLTIKLFNVLGEQVFSKDLGFVQNGSHQFILDTNNLAGNSITSGVYFYVFSGTNIQESRKLVLLK